MTKKIRLQFAGSVLSVVAISMLCYPFADLIGYRTVALILMFVVSLLAMQMSLYPVLAAAVLSAAIWDFFFIPPNFTFHPTDPADTLMLGMYFAIALLNGVLTARIRRLEEISREKESRENTLKLYDTLFNSLSHELRTPIATILGASDHLLNHDAKLREEDKVALYTEIDTAAERLDHLTKDLLNQSRLDSGFIRPKLDWCDVGELVYTVVNRLGAALGQHHLELNLPDDLPLVRLDFGLMEQVLHNIVRNAAMHTPAGGRISISAMYDSGVLHLTVADSGPGFPPEEQDRLFEKFHRLSNTRTSGIGLGLSIAKGFVEAHGGTIRAENQPGGGARISIHLPVKTSFLKSEGT